MRTIISLIMLTLIASIANSANAADANQPTITVAGVTLPVPTPDQANWQDCELGMFIHFDLEVFNTDCPPKSWGKLDPAIFDPKNLDTDQWLQVAQSLGAKYACFTAKHGTGFLMWQSDLYPFGVKQTPWRDDKGDVVLDYLASCKKFNIQPGLYCSATGHAWWFAHHGPIIIKHGVPTGNPENLAAFTDMDLKMYADLWKRTGPIPYMWFDGGLNFLNGKLTPLIEKFQPHAVCFNGPTNGALGGLARWSGNEKGFIADRSWNTIDISDNEKDRGLGSPDGKFWIPIETNVPLRYHDWLWRPDTVKHILSLSALATDYLDSVGRGGNLIINANIGPDGLVPQPDAQRMAEFGDLIHRWFDKPIAQINGSGPSVEVDLPAPQPIDCVSIMEDIRQGQRVRKYTIEANVNGQWTTVATGTAIGHKRIELFDRITATAVRVRADESAAPPIWKQLAVFNIDPLPPDPTNPAVKAQAAAP